MNFDKLLYIVAYAMAAILFIVALPTINNEIFGMSFILLLIGIGFEIKFRIKNIRR